MPAQPAATPVPGPAAFRGRGRNARLSQAAILLSLGAAGAGAADRVEYGDAIGLPDDLASCGQPEPIAVAQAIAPLAIDLDDHLARRRVPVPSATSVELMSRLVDHPDPVTASALCEANLHSDSLLVRTAAAVAALDTTGPRDDLLAHLVAGAARGDRLTKELARIGVARVAPQHTMLRRVVGQPSPLTGRDRPSHTAVLTHGTFASGFTWWRPGGEFYTYLDSLVPPLKMHDPSFSWSGMYSDGARQLAAQQLVNWVPDQNLQRPDFFAHSHGGTVANLATVRGLEFNRLVLLSWPVHEQWFPDFNRVSKLIDIRVRLDLIILADRGRQSFTPPAAGAGKVSSHINGWFDHSLTYQPSYWDEYGLPGVL
jgi:hypothetical protein